MGQLKEDKPSEYYAIRLTMMQSQAANSPCVFLISLKLPFLNGVLSFKAKARCNPQLFYSSLNAKQDSQREQTPASSLYTPQ